MQHILAVGSDLTLLYTRGLVLGRSGCAVKTATPEQGLLMLDNGDFDLLVLCHSVSENDVLRLCRRARDASRPAKILLIESPAKGSRGFAQVDCRFLLESGPHVLVRVIRQLLAGSTPEECDSPRASGKLVPFASITGSPPAGRALLVRYPDITKTGSFCPRLAARARS